MTAVHQRAQFCTSFDGTRIAYAIAGNGPRLVRAPHWLTHITYEWQSSYWVPWLERMTRDYSLLRTDLRGCGLSDRNVSDVSFESLVRDLEAVVESSGWDDFTLYGASQGGGIAIEYAARHPEKVSRLVLNGAYARGYLKRELAPTETAAFDNQIRLIEIGWESDDPAYRQFFATQFMPTANLEQLRGMNELQRVSTSAANAAQLVRTAADIDVRESATRVTCPTLITHSTGDRRVPFEEGRLLAALIPNSTLVPLDSVNHALLPGDRAFESFFEALNAFAPPARMLTTRDIGEPVSRLTAREREVLERLAQGLDNAQIAAHLGLAEKTVRNHLTRVFEKIGAENRGQAIVLAREAGLGRHFS